MIHVLITSDAIIRDMLVNEYQFHAHATEPGAFQSKGTIMLYREKLEAAVISDAIDTFFAEKIWIISPARVVSTDHELGDIIMPNVFLAYDHEIDSVEFNRTNRDAFLHDPLFLHHYEEQSDLNFETFGLSIGGICVTKNDGMDNIDREQIEFAYSADCVDETCYFLVEAAKKLGREEDVYPILAIVGQESTVEDQARIIKNIPPVLIYLQSRIAGADGEDTEMMTLADVPDDDYEPDVDDDFDETEDMEGFHEVRS